jgi:hypothetical protein
VNTPADQPRRPQRIAAGALVTLALSVLAVLGYTGGIGLATGAYYYCLPGYGYGYGYCPPTTTTPPPPRPPDHYLLYWTDETAQPGESLTVIDQFGTRRVQIEEAFSLLNPAEKRRTGRPAEPIRNPDDHLVCHELVPQQSANRDVRVSNQFGTRTLRVGRPLTLCAPASKSLPGEPVPGAPPSRLDHYLCYDVSNETPNLPSETMTAIDEFGTRTIRIDEARDFCNPVEKRRDGRAAVPITQPDIHFVCYRITSHSPTFQPRDVRSRDQFGLEDPLELKYLRRLCVPSSKIEP